MHVHYLYTTLLIIFASLEVSLSLTDPFVAWVEELHERSRGSFRINDLSRLLVESQFTQNTSCHTLDVIQWRIQQLQGQKTDVYYTLTMSDGGQRLYNPAPIHMHKITHNTVERCKSYLNKQRNGVHVGNGGFVHWISGHDMQSTSGALHDLLHSHPILRERGKKDILVIRWQNSRLYIVFRAKKMWIVENLTILVLIPLDDFGYLILFLFFFVAILMNNNII